LKYDYRLLTPKFIRDLLGKATDVWTSVSYANSYRVASTLVPVTLTTRQSK